MCNGLYIIRRNFECEIQPSGFFDHAIVRRVKAACSRSPAEVRIKHLEDQVKEKLPLPGEAVWRARTHFFIVPTWSAKGMIEKAKWIALAIAFHNGPRASNLTLRDGPSAEDHCIRARDLLFHVDIDDQKIAVHGGEPLRNLLGGDLLKIGKVSDCELTYLTSKSGGSKQILGRSTSCESRVLDDICEWVMFSGVLEADELTTRYPPANPSGRSGRKVLTKKEFQSVFRWKEDNIGLPTQSLSAKSVRIGYATHAAMDGMSRKEINEGGGWSERSIVSRKYYTAKGCDTRTTESRELPSGKPLGGWCRVGNDGSIQDVINLGKGITKARLDLATLRDANVGGSAGL